MMVQQSNAYNSNVYTVTNIVTRTGSHRLSAITVSQVEMSVAQYVYNSMFASTCHCCVDYVGKPQGTGYT